MKDQTIIYPVFLHASFLCQDDFWKKIFEELAYGISPYGTFFDGGAICCRYKTQNFLFNFTNQTPIDVYTKLKEIFQSKLKLKSKLDHFNDKRIFLSVLSQQSCNEWVQIKKKNIKDILIEMYVIDMKNKHHLSATQTKQLFSIIMLGFNFKLLTNKDIIYNTSITRIENIEGIVITHKRIFLDRELQGILELETDKQVLTENCHEYWNKYLCSLNIC